MNVESMGVNYLDIVICALLFRYMLCAGIRDILAGKRCLRCGFIQ